MKNSSFFVAVLLVALSAHAQDSTNTQPAGTERGVIPAKSGGLVVEAGATVRDLATFQDKQWTALTIAQIVAASADGRTSLYNLHHCVTCEETGVSRFVVGREPDLHKYLIAGIVEIGVEAITAHYLRSHGPVRKWYWRYVWTLPQTLSLYEHSHASISNAGVSLGCEQTGMPCH